MAKPRPDRVDPRSSARLAAVQALYRMEMSGAGSGEVLAEIKAGGAAAEVAEDERVTADPALVRRIIEDVVRQRAAIDPLLAELVRDARPFERLEPLVRAVLRAGSAELMAGEGSPARTPAKVIVNEYMNVSHAFFNGGEPKFINGVLDAAARRLRPAELPGPAVT